MEKKNFRVYVLSFLSSQQHRSEIVGQICCVAFFGLLRFIYFDSILGTHINLRGWVLYVKVLQKAGKRVRVIHGTRDAVIPFKSSVSLVERHPNVRLTTVTSADHGTVVFGREAQLAEELAEEILMI